MKENLSKEAQEMSTESVVSVGGQKSVFQICQDSQSQQKTNCQKCGNCCKKFRIEIKDPKFIKEILFNFREKFHHGLKETVNITLVLDGECEFLDNGKCSIYDTRPERCKNYFCKKTKSINS